MNEHFTVNIGHILTEELQHGYYFNPEPINPSPVATIAETEAESTTARPRIGLFEKALQTGVIRKDDWLTLQQIAERLAQVKKDIAAAKNAAKKLEKSGKSKKLDVCLNLQSQSNKEDSTSGYL